MSYSFSARGAAKTDVILDADAKIDKLCQDMDAHLHDREVLLQNMRNTVNALPDPDYSEQVTVSMSGYITWATTSTGKRITTISSCVCASLAPKL